ncbi:MAG: DNA repair protein RadA [Clostridia bacterium]|nr:DNA repair protein RadA [Clostridia bacterium]
MPRERTLFVCRECGYESAKWMGQCPSCKQWNTLEEVETPKISKSRSGKTVVRKIDEGRILPLKEIRNSSTYRIDTKIEELNRVLGGGIVPGSVVLAGGEPGIGKSTLFLQMADNIAKEEDVLYISGEESAEQVAMRFERLGLTSDLRFMAENQLEDILSAAETVRPKVMIVDSIQTIFDSDIESAAGSVSQVRECAARLARYAKSSEVAVIIIGHVTKEGNIAGPRILEHLVDTVLYFEGENQSAFRILRAVKNRFGSTNEIGVFDMKATGMEEVTNPSQILLSTRQKDMPGSCIYCAVEGTRPVLLEVEALVSESSFGTPRRMTSGVDYNRVNLIVAVLEKRIGLKLYNQDIYVNIGGGMRIWDSALDLAIAASIVSSFRNKPLRQGIVLAGEIGLTGEVRHVSQIEKRIAEAARMGMEAIILPKSNYSPGIKDIEQIPIKTLHDALGNIF